MEGVYGAGAGEDSVDSVEGVSGAGKDSVDSAEGVYGAGAEVMEKK